MSDCDCQEPCENHPACLDGATAPGTDGPSAPQEGCPHCGLLTCWEWRAKQAEGKLRRMEGMYHDAVERGALAESEALASHSLSRRCQDGGDCMVISRELYHDLRQAQDELKASKAIGPQEPKAPLNQSLPSPSHPEREKEKCLRCLGHGTTTEGDVCEFCAGSGSVFCAGTGSVEGEGRRSASGVADADPVRVGDFFGIPAFTHPDVKPGIVGIVSAGEVTATITGTAPQRPKADPQMVTCFQCRGDGTCFATDDPCPVCGGLGSITDDPVAPVPQTEGECPDCEDGTLYDPDALPLAPTVPCPTCSGTGKEGEK